VDAIRDWYNLASTSRVIIDHYRNKLETLGLDKGTEASTYYVNDFIICCQKLEEKNEGYTLSTKRQKFLDQITDEEYDVAKQWLTGENITFDECVLKIRAREHHLLKEGNDSLLKARRFKKNEESKPKSGGNPGQTADPIHSWVYPLQSHARNYKARPHKVERNVQQ
jgi:hypothetical protein